MVNVRNVERAGHPVALDQCNHFVQVRAGAAFAGTRTAVTTDVGLVGFDDLPAPAQRPGLFDLERFVDAVAHEPGRLVGHAEHAVKLMAAHALFAGAQQMRRQNPLVEGNLGTLENGPDGDAVLLAAVAAEQEARTVRLTLKAALAIRPAAVRAYRPGRPAHGF